MPEQNFAGRTAIIVGGASGMGLLAGQDLAKQGATVILADVNGEKVEALAADIRANGGNAYGVKCDVRKVEDIENAVAFTREKGGSVDIMIYTAGGFAGRIFNCPEPFQSRPYEVLDWGIDVNLKGALFFCRAVIRTMIEQKRGVMIVLGSIDGVTGSAWSVDYSAAKSGMIGMVKGLALLGAPHNVRACCVSPGPVLTRAAMANMPTPMGRAAEPQEVVDLILYLASDKAAFISGDNYLIDGARACMVR